MHESIMLGTQLVPDECSFPSKVSSSFKIQILLQIPRFKPTHLCKSHSSLCTYSPARSAELPAFNSHQATLSYIISSFRLNFLLPFYSNVPTFPSLTSTRLCPTLQCLLPSPGPYFDAKSL